MDLSTMMGGMGGMGGKMMKGKDFEAKMKQIFKGGEIAGIVNTMLKESGDKFSDNLKDFARQCKAAPRRRKGNFYSKIWRGMKGMDFFKLMGGLDFSKMKGMMGAGALGDGRRHLTDGDQDDEEHD